MAEAGNEYTYVYIGVSNIESFHFINITGVAPKEKQTEKCSDRRAEIIK